MIPSSSATWTSSDAPSPLSALSATERGQQLLSPLCKKTATRSIIWHLSLRNTMTLFSIRATVSHLWTTQTSLRSVDLGYQWRSHWFRTVPYLDHFWCFLTPALQSSSHPSINEWKSFCTSPFRTCSVDAQFIPSRCQDEEIINIIHNISI